MMRDERSKDREPEDPLSPYLNELSPNILIACFNIIVLTFLHVEFGGVGLIINQTHC